MTKNKKENIKISFIDEPASEGVTGSAVLIQTPKHKILLDYGLYQSNDRFNDFLINNRKSKNFKAKEIDYVFISHLHADHALLVPKLYKEGFKGKIIISNNSYGILKIMATDCAFINERDITSINEHNHKDYAPLYGMEEINAMLNDVHEYPTNQCIQLDEELGFELIPAGHLLGSCQILLYITINNLIKTILYTGDIGNHEISNYFVGKFQPVTKFVDVVIGESTYGDRPDLKVGLKKRMDDLNKIKTIIDTQVNQLNGRVLIPSFAQSRCQQLALTIYQMYKDKEWQPVIYIDSPLAITIFKEYAEILEGEEKKLFDELMRWDKLKFVQKPEDSMALVQSKNPCVIISTSGMCTVGRVRHHLKSMIPNPVATVLFVGYSTDGSLASLLKDDKRKEVTIDNTSYTCQCASFSLTSFSGHAPFNQLLEYYASLHTNKIILHHGGIKAKETLKSSVELELEKQCKSTRIVIANSSLKFNV